MLKSKSLEDINCLSDGQLFTELTPQEAAAIEGGYRVRFNDAVIKKVALGVDLINLEADGRQLFQGAITLFGKGKPILLNETHETPDGSLTQIRLSKGGKLFDGLILVDQVTEDGTVKGDKTVTLSGKGTALALNYSVS